MNDFQQIAATVLGILLILVGLALVVFRKDTSANHLKVWNVEVNLSTPALVVLAAGCALFALPIFAPHKANSWSWNTGGGVTSTAKPTAPGVEITQEEKEPNDSRGQANVLAFGATASGAVSESERDFFRIDVPKDRRERNRLIVRRVTNAGGLYVWVFNENEKQIHTEFITQMTLSVVIPSAAHYVVRLEGWRERQGYEMLIRAEEPADPRR